MGGQPTNFEQWGQGHAFLPVVAAREIAAFASVVPDVLAWVAVGQSPPALVPSLQLQDWLKLYRRPGQVQDAVADSFFPVKGRRARTSKLLRVLFASIRALSRQNADEVLAFAKENPKAWERSIRQSLRIRRLINRWQLRSIDNGFLGASEDYDQQIARAIKTPEVVFLLRVWTPCMVHAGDTPWNLYRRSCSGDRRALDLLLRLDKSVLFLPRIANQFWRASLTDTVRFGALRRAAGHGLPKLSAKRQRERFIALVSRLFQPFDGIETTEIRDLFDAVARKESQEKRRIDKDLPASTEALTKAVWRLRDQWQIPALPTPDKTKS